MKNDLLTTVILVHQFDDRLIRSLKSIAWSDVLIILDSNVAEKERTELKKQINKHHPAAQIVQAPQSKEQNFSQVRNFAVSTVTTDWTLFVDSDEWVSSELQDEIMTTIANTDCQAFQLKRQDFFGGEPLQFGETATVKLVRLGKTSQGTWVNTVHEEWQFKGKVGELKAPLFHEPHQTITSFITKINTYSRLVAHQRTTENQTVSVLEMISFPVGKFFQNYFWRQGFRDGWRGLIYAVMMSLHSFFVRVHMWEMVNSD